MQLAGEDERYSRQILFAEIGVAGQQAIRKATVCIIGCGALGSLQAEALVRAGVGRLHIIDRDTVDFSNLQRQWLFGEAAALQELPKAVAARERLREINSGVDVRATVVDFQSDNAEELVEGACLLLDGTDNFETRFLINEVSVKKGIPWVYGAAVGSYGVVLPLDPVRGPCFRCVYPEGPEGSHPTCDVDGVIAPTTASVAALQVAAALRMLVGWEPFESRLQTFDVWQGTHRSVSAGARDAECPVCVGRQFSALEGRTNVPVSLCGRNAVQLHQRGKTIDLEELAHRLERLGSVRANEFALKLTLPQYKVTVFPDGRAIVHGTTDVTTARGLYAQIVGA
jgi:molybdopterin-synthase adenylyltransferase